MFTNKSHSHCYKFGYKHSHYYKFGYKHKKLVLEIIIIISRYTAIIANEKV